MLRSRRRLLRQGQSQGQRHVQERRKVMLLRQGHEGLRKAVQERWRLCGWEVLRRGRKVVCHELLRRQVRTEDRQLAVSSSRYKSPSRRRLGLFSKTVKSAAMKWGNYLMFTPSSRRAKMSPGNAVVPAERV